ncbi:hypothetical protein ABZ069_33655 [Streptomyces microflavus]
MIEFVGRIEDGMQELEAQAHAWLAGPRSPAVIYTGVEEHRNGNRR